MLVLPCPRAAGAPRAEVASCVRPSDSDLLTLPRKLLYFLGLLYDSDRATRPQSPRRRLRVRPGHPALREGRSFPRSALRVRPGHPAVQDRGIALGGGELHPKASLGWHPDGVSQGPAEESACLLLPRPSGCSCYLAREPRARKNATIQVRCIPIPGRPFMEMILPTCIGYGGEFDTMKRLRGRLFNLFEGRYVLRALLYLIIALGIGFCMFLSAMMILVSMPI